MKVSVRCLKNTSATVMCLGAVLAGNESSAQEDAVTGAWNVRQQFATNGVEPYAILSSEVWGDVSGGLKTGVWYDQLLDFGIRLDTAKLGWWDNGSFLIQGHWVQHNGSGGCFDEYTGGFNPVSGIMAGDQIRIFNLYYRQSWLDEAVLIKVGQIAVDDDFMLSDYAGLFLDSAFGSMPSQVGTPLATSCGNNAAFPIYSVASPGMVLQVRPVESFYSQAGLYYGNPGPDESDNYGFDWVNQSSAELGLFWENGVNYKLFQRAGTFKVGLAYHTGPKDDFNTSYNGNVPVEKQTVPNYYAVNDFQLLADKEGHAKLGLFCRGGFTPDPDLSTVSLYADAGVNWFAPLPVRPDDVAGVAVSYTKFGESFRQSTGPNGIAADETTLEFTYKAQITRWLTMQADTQLLFNPAVNSGSNTRETAVVLGMRAVVTF